MGDDLQELRRHINGCEAEFTRRLRRFDKGGGYASSAALTAQAWLRWKCNFSPAAAADRVAVARELDSLPLAAEAFADGDLSYGHAAMIARTAEKLGDKMEANAETILVTAAKELDLGRLRVVTLKLQHLMDPDSVREEANESHERRFLSLSQTLDGVFYLNGRLDAEGGATLQAALNALGGPPADEDKRTPKQRRADSLVELARQKLDSGSLPKVGGQRPHLAVTVSTATLANQPGSPAAELEWAQPIPAETARRLACDAAVTRSFSARSQSSRRRARPAAPSAGRSAGPWWSGTRAAGSPAATGRPPGPMRIISGIGPTAASTSWTTWCSSAGATTARFMKRVGSCS